MRQGESLILALDPVVWCLVHSWHSTNIDGSALKQLGMNVRNTTLLYAGLLPTFAFMEEKERAHAGRGRRQQFPASGGGGAGRPEELRCGSQVSLFPLLEPRLASMAVPLGDLLGDQKAAFVDVTLKSPSWHLCRSRQPVSVTS